MPSPSSEAGRAYAVASEEQLDAASQCPAADSRWIRRARRDTTDCYRGRTWQMHLLRAGQIACRLLEKHSKFDRDNVRCLTGGGGMTAVSRGLGPVSRETNGEASAGSAPQDSADGTEC